MRFVSLFVALLLPAVAAAQVTLPAIGTPFTLRPGDRIVVTVLRDSSLSGTYPVDETGRAVLPMVGARVVTATPWPLLRDSLVAAYTRQLNEPTVQLVPLRRVFVMGFVMQPGAFYADPTLPIAGAIALAGGAAPEGDLRSIRVVRDGAVVMTEVGIEDPRALSDLRSGDQIFVQRRGWFDRNAPLFVSAVIGFASIVVTLIVAR